jgi:ribonuclease HII
LPPTGRQAGLASSKKPRRGELRAPALFAFDRALDVDWVVGADEAGRGCLAGPLVAAAVAFDQTTLSMDDLRALADLDDSKKRKGDRRTALFVAVTERAAAIAIAIRPAAVIDRDGLHKTNIAALADATSQIGRQDGIHLTDGFEVDLPWGKTEKLIKGDSTSAAIAAASIIAKEVRDTYMVRMADVYPGYGFEGHVGYASAGHREAIEALGPCPLHRMSFNSSSYGPSE